MPTQLSSRRLAGKAAIITGGGTGIGRATAEAFVAEGAKVLIVGRREAPIKELAAKYDGEMAYLQADVTQSGIAKAIMDHAMEVFGRVDILVNNAGTAVIKPLSMITDDEIEEVLATNVRAVLAMSREAIPALEKSKGSIINLSSVAAQTAVPGMSAYAATKSGVDRLSKILAVELGPMGIRVNVVAPGLTQTDMLSVMPDETLTQLVNEGTALRRLGEPADVAQSLVWLASDDAGWITGQVIQASGGLLLN
ncbi:MAG: SDR family NAD(P)-dependent oxidoreductase [Alphaproteobacteria bacterium]